MTSHDEWHNNWHIESGAGATTIAAGLAGALSETGGGKVLLVDLTGKQGAAHHFSQLKPACSLFDVLREEKCESPASQQQFQVGSVGDLNGSLHPARTKAFDALKHVVSILQDSNTNAKLAVVLNKTVSVCRPG